MVHIVLFPTPFHWINVVIFYQPYHDLVIQVPRYNVNRNSVADSVGGRISGVISSFACFLHGEVIRSLCDLTAAICIAMQPDEPISLEALEHALQRRLASSSLGSVIILLGSCFLPMIQILELGEKIM